MVVLKWKPPENDGGRPVLYYILEYKDKLSDWMQGGKTEKNDPEGRIEGLKEKETYQFRVRAVNKAGCGEPSQPTGNHLCKHKNCES